MTSLVPATTAWIAATKLAAGPVLIYAAVFVLINIAFLGYQQAVLSQASDTEVTKTTRHFTRVRALVTLSIFAFAACIAGWSPLAGFSLVCCVLLLYLRPQVPGEGLEQHAYQSHSKSIRVPDPHAKKEIL
jgi:uncharacterized membrane protein